MFTDDLPCSNRRQAYMRLLKETVRQIWKARKAGVQGSAR
jgi:hypothetical protein